MAIQLAVVLPLAPLHSRFRVMGAAALHPMRLQCGDWRCLNDVAAWLLGDALTSVVKGPAQSNSGPLAKLPEGNTPGDEGAVASSVTARGQDIL